MDFKIVLIGDKPFKVAILLLLGYRFWGLGVDIAGGVLDVLLDLSLPMGEQLGSFISEGFLIVMFWSFLNFGYNLPEYLRCGK